MQGSVCVNVSNQGNNNVNVTVRNEGNNDISVNIKSKQIVAAKKLTSTNTDIIDMLCSVNLSFRFFFPYH